jgi:hypothetical protein
MPRRLTLETLECTPVDIAMSVVENGARVHSPSVLGVRAILAPGALVPGRVRSGP